LKITREIKTATLVISSILLFIWGYNFLKGHNLLNSHTKLYVEYDNVEGLATAAPVTISGKTIGKVSAITLNKDGKLLVEIQIDNKDFPISKTSIAQIYEPGFIGGKQIAIIPNYKDENLVVTGDKLLADVKEGMMSAVGSKLEPTQQKVDRLLVNADNLMGNLNDVLDVQTKQNLKSTIVELNKTLEEFRKTAQKANSLIDNNEKNIATTMANANKTTANFAKLSDSLAKINFGKTVKNLENTLASVDKIMINLQSGKGTMGKLMKDETLYNNFAKTSKELELLLKDVRLYPTRYVNVSLFGKKNKPYIAPDSITKSK
jgi:phospholipid/cholesterol/gamma-HCH transport system substrate-binding protein